MKWRGDDCQLMGRARRLSETAHRAQHVSVSGSSGFWETTVFGPDTLSWGGGELMGGRCVGQER